MLSNTLCPLNITFISNLPISLACLVFCKSMVESSNHHIQGKGSSKKINYELFIKKQETLTTCRSAKETMNYLLMPMPYVSQEIFHIKQFLPHQLHYIFQSVLEATPKYPPPQLKEATAMNLFIIIM